MTADSVARIVDRVLRIPAAYRVFDVSAPQARDLFGIGDELMTELLDHGFPSVDRADLKWFDRKDLKNVMLRSRLQSGQTAALHAIADSFRRAQGGSGAHRYRLQMVGRCPDPGHPGECDYLLDPAVDDVIAQEEWATRSAPNRFVFDLVLPGEKAGQVDLPAPVRAIFAELGRLEFQNLPAELSSDLGFLAEHGMADCRLASTHACSLARQAGVSLRSAGGVVLVPPFSIVHQWIELELDGRWMPFDPFFVAALEQWGALLPGELTPESVVAGAVWRLWDRAAWLMYHNDQGIAPVLFTVLGGPATQ